MSDDTQRCPQNALSAPSRPETGGPLLLDHERLADVYATLKEDHEGLGQTLDRTIYRCVELNTELKVLKAKHAALVAAASYVVEMSQWTGSLGNAPEQYRLLMEGIFAMSRALNALPKEDR